MNRSSSFGENNGLSLADRFGRYLSTRKAQVVFSKHTIRSAADIGCGFDANIGRFLFSKAEILHLVDISINQVGVASNERIHEGYLPEILHEMEDATLDAVVMNNVLEHLTDVDGTLECLFQKMSKNGILFLNVPTWRGKWLLEKAAFRWNISPREEMNDHKIYFDLKTLWPRLVSSGFQPENIKCKKHKGGTNLYAVCRK
jgi:predicted TPR repeat methyltransferase